MASKRVLIDEQETDSDPALKSPVPTSVIVPTSAAEKRFEKTCRKIRAAVSGLGPDIRVDVFMNSRFVLSIGDASKDGFIPV